MNISVETIQYEGETINIESNVDSLKFDIESEALKTGIERSIVKKRLVDTLITFSIKDYYQHTYNHLGSSATNIYGETSSDKEYPAIFIDALNHAKTNRKLKYLSEETRQRVFVEQIYNTWRHERFHYIYGLVPDVQKKLYDRPKVNKNIFYTGTISSVVLAASVGIYPVLYRNFNINYPPQNIQDLLFESLVGLGIAAQAKFGLSDVLWNEYLSEKAMNKKFEEKLANKAENTTDNISNLFNITFQKG